MVVPFLTDENNCLIVETPFPNWPKTDYGRSLSEPLSGMFPQAKNIQVITDGIAAGSAIIQENTALRTKGNLITIYSASGIGGALFHDGEMVNGTRKIVGAYGHITVAPEDQEVCGCGSRGCLECMVSRKRLWNRFVNQKDLYQKSLLADIPENKVTFPQLFAASAKGDELCRKESAYYAEMFAIAIRNFVLVADPGTVVFQGDFGKADDVFRKRLYNKLHEFKYIREVDQLLIEYDDKDLIKQEAIGATYILINDYLRHPEHYME